MLLRPASPSVWANLARRAFSPYQVNERSSLSRFARNLLISAACARIMAAALLAKLAHTTRPLHPGANCSFFSLTASFSASSLMN